MTPDRRVLVLAVLLIVLGVAWLLTALGYVPDIDWLWTLGLGAVGVLTLVLYGLDKVTVVVAPLFLLASLLSVARQTGRLALNLEAPLLVILAGVLLLIARQSRIPSPQWLSK